MTDQPIPLPPRRPLPPITSAEIDLMDELRKSAEHQGTFQPQKPPEPRWHEPVRRQHSEPPPQEPLMHLEDLGRMSAEAVMMQCEATIKSVEDMGHTVHGLVKRLGEALVQCDGDLKHVAETAAAIREKAKHTEAVIEHVNDLSKSIRVACADFQKKVAL